MKNTLILFCLLFIGIQAYSNNGKNKSDYEISFGLNQPLPPSESLISYEDAKLGFGLEVLKFWYPERKLNLVSGIDLKQFKYNYDDVSCGAFCSLTDSEIRAYSLSIPILARYNFGETVKFFIEAGPEVNYIPYARLIARRAILPPVGDGEYYDYSVRWNEPGDKFSFGIRTGIGLIVPIASYEFVFSSSFHTIFPYVNVLGSPHSQHFTINLGVRL